MLFTNDHDEIRRSLQKFIANEIGGGAEVMLMALCKMMGTLPSSKGNLR